MNGEEDDLCDCPFHTSIEPSVYTAGVAKSLLRGQASNSSANMAPNKITKPTLARGHNTSNNLKATVTGPKYVVTGLVPVNLANTRHD